MAKKYKARARGHSKSSESLASLGSVCAGFGVAPRSSTWVRNLLLPIWDQIIRPAPVKPRGHARRPASQRPTTPPPTYG